MLGDTKGIIDAEANPVKLIVKRSEDILHHANHYLYGTDGFTDTSSGEYRVNSVSGYDRMVALLTGNKGQLDLKFLQGVLRDHENKPDTTCAHVNPARTKGHHSRTLDGIIYLPDKRKVWLTKGNPCENEFLRYKL